MTNSIVNVRTTGNANGTGALATANGVRSDNANVTVINSQVTVMTTGNATSGANTSAFGVRLQGNNLNSLAKVSGSTINVNTKGSASGTSTSSQSIGVQGSFQDAVIITNSVINSTTNGNAFSTGNTGSFGVRAFGNLTLSGSSVNAKSTGNATGASFSQATGTQIINGNGYVLNSTI